MGKLKYSWQDTGYVLAWLGKRTGVGRKVYRRYVSEEINLGHRPGTGGLGGRFVSGETGQS